jgi:toxin YoeB
MSNRLLAWTDEAWDDYVYWQTQDKKTLKRINKLIKSSKNTPFGGNKWSTTYFVIFLITGEFF